MELAIPIGKLLSSVKITRVIQEWGVLCRTDDGLEGFVHVRAPVPQLGPRAYNPDQSCL
jgi:hypothetical protein